MEPQRSEPLDDDSASATDQNFTLEAKIKQRCEQSLSGTGGTELDLSRLEMRSFPSNLPTFPRLRMLNLRKNCLALLPTNFSSLFPLLTALDASENQLEALPDSLNMSLQRLNVASNKLTVLPGSLSRLEHLEELIARDNALKSVDEQLENLKKLRKVDLSGNVNLENAPERFRRLHERNMLLHSRSRRRELITRALRVRTAVSKTLISTTASPISPTSGAHPGSLSVKKKL